MVDLFTDEMSQFGFLELSESQGIHEDEDQLDGAPAKQKDSPNPASQCKSKYFIKIKYQIFSVFK